MKGKIESQAQQEMSDAQRQYYLRHQLKAIQEELARGEGEEVQTLSLCVEKASLSEGRWSVTTKDRIDPVEARRGLDEDHYDLDKVKERIIEYLAVRKLKGDMNGPILCFVGPPGGGTTSLCQP